MNSQVENKAPEKNVTRGLVNAFLFVIPVGLVCWTFSLWIVVKLLRSIF